jgi:hypothetical protein
MKMTVWLKMNWPFIILGLSIFAGGGCSLNPETRLNHNPSTKEAAMNLDQKAAAPIKIPMIDTAAPVEVETATFGLG